MPRGSKLMLSFASWPAEDQRRWEAAFETGDRFDESGHGAHLASTTRRARRESYGRYLAFISATHQDLLTRPPEARIDRILWPNMWPGAGGCAEILRSPTILSPFAAP